MAFSYTVSDIVIVGDCIASYGTYVNDGGSTGGDINTQTALCIYIKLDGTGEAVVAGKDVAHETFPCAGNAVTIVTAANKSGTWYAVGKGVAY